MVEICDSNAVAALFFQFNPNWKHLILGLFSPALVGKVPFKIPPTLIFGMCMCVEKERFEFIGLLGGVDQLIRKPQLWSVWNRLHFHLISTLQSEHMLLVEIPIVTENHKLHYILFNASLCIEIQTKFCFYVFIWKPSCQKEVVMKINSNCNLKIKLILI